MKNALAIDLVDLDMWSNKSFKDFIHDELKKVNKDKDFVSKKHSLKKIKKLLYERHESLVLKNQPPPIPISSWNN